MAADFPRHKVSRVPSIDLNADIGEGSGCDSELLDLVSSASISCGAHAGDDRTMRVAIEAALRRGVSVGAHPGYPDPANFGRRETGDSPATIRDLMLSQLETFASVCADAGATFAHVKPHGALYNRAQRDRGVAESIVHAVAAVDGSLLVLGMPGSELLAAATRFGLPAAREAFLDRAYDAGGNLLSRDQAGAVIDDPATAAARAESIAATGTLEAADGSSVAVTAETLCVHGDNPGAVALVHAARTRLEQRGIAIVPLATRRPR